MAGKEVGPREGLAGQPHLGVRWGYLEMDILEITLERWINLPWMRQKGHSRQKESHKQSMEMWNDAFGKLRVVAFSWSALLLRQRPENGLRSTQLTVLFFWSVFFVAGVVSVLYSGMNCGKNKILTGFGGVIIKGSMWWEPKYKIKLN